MDFLLKEIDEIKSDLRRLEEKISRLEDDSNFKPEDVRYKRLVDEKHLLLSHLCQLRTSIYSHGVVAAPVESSSSNAGNSEETLGTKRQRTTEKVFSNELKPLVINPIPQAPTVDLTSHNSEITAATAKAAGTVEGKVDSQPGQKASPINLEESPATNTSSAPPSSSGTSNGNKGVVPPLPAAPALQVEEYLSTKMKLAQIMRDFNDKKISFLGTDGSKIHIAQYQTISTKVKGGEDISLFLKGQLVIFVTAIDKKKRSITETKLFIPDFEFIDV